MQIFGRYYDATVLWLQADMLLGITIAQVTRRNKYHCTGRKLGRRTPSRHAHGWKLTPVGVRRSTVVRSCVNKEFILVASLH